MPRIGASWIWPLPYAFGNPTVIRTVDDERCGVDLGYERPLPEPIFLPVYAVQAGEVSFAGETDTGYGASIDHGKWCTHYGHMKQMFVTRNLGRVRRRARVRAGDVIGYASEHPVHLRFELWQRAVTGGFKAVHPAAHLASWLVMPTLSTATPSAATANSEAA
ncbi:MAG TPA: peptidoglycan DD-metalloendopeptidase family protein [Kofleriaceae bacterium]